MIWHIALIFMATFFAVWSITGVMAINRHPNGSELQRNAATATLIFSIITLMLGFILISGVK